MGSRCVDGQQPFQATAGNAFVDDQPPQGRAALAGRADGGKHDRADGQFQIGGRRHDHAVVPAQFQERSAQPGGDRLGHGAAHPHRAGGRDQRQRCAMAARACPMPGPGPTTRPSRPGGARAFPPARGGDRLAGHGAERRLLRRLPDHGVAADQGQHRVPGPNGHREIEGRDHAHGPQRMPLLGQAVPRPLADDRQAVELPAQPHGEVAHVDHFLDFAQGLLGDLADLPAHQRGQVGLLPAELAADAADQLASPRGRHVAPGGKGLHRRLHHAGRHPRPRPPQTRPAASRRWASEPPSSPRGLAASRGRSRPPPAPREPQADREAVYRTGHGISQWRRPPARR